MFWKIEKKRYAQDDYIVKLYVVPVSSETGEGKAAGKAECYRVPYSEEERFLPGAILDEEQLDEVRQLQQECDAMRRVLYALTYGDRTEKEIKRTMRSKWHFSRETADRIVQRLTDAGLIDEKRSIVGLGWTGIERLYSRKKILAKAYERGYTDEAIRYLRQGLEKVDFVPICREAALVRIGHRDGDDLDTEELDSIRASLYRAGFTESEIRQALEDLFLDEGIIGEEDYYLLFDSK